MVYLFYKTTLRGLTFYSANRWYLLLLSLFCFLLPLIDIGELLEPTQMNRAIVIQAIPAVNEFVGLSGAAAAEASREPGFSVWDAAMALWLAGSLVLLVRLLISYLSYRTLREKAQPVYYKGIRLFQVDAPILPFSFGNAIYLNQQRHTEAELKEIIRHELVHVQQCHTLDVVCAELLCIINWFNPFAWLLRHAIRQNLEFIADSKVVQHGADKTAYQYLLLNVVGGVAYPMANQFNLSPLKKRIAMLNRLPSAKAHLVRFLLVLPLAGVLLLACRDNQALVETATVANNPSLPEKNKDQQMPDGAKRKSEASIVTGRNGNAIFSGIILDAETHQAVPGVTIVEPASGMQTQTDSRGFYIMEVPVTTSPFEPNIVYSKKGYGTITKSQSYRDGKTRYRSALIVSLWPNDVHGNSVIPTHGDQFVNSSMVSALPTYEELAAYVPTATKNWEAQKRFELARKKTDDVYMVFEGQSYVTSGGGWASVDEITDVVVVDGEQMTGAEVNRKLARHQVKTMGAMDRSFARKTLGIDAALLQISTQPLAKK